MLNVVFASDENYVPYLSVALISLLKNNYNDFDTINIFILDNGITKNSQKKLLTISEEYNSNLIFIKPKMEELTNLNSEISSRLPLSTFSRLFLDKLLPHSIDKVIYMDCDILVLDSIKNMYNNNLKDYFCAGVIEQVQPAIKKQIKFKEKDNYINAGIILINLDRWRKENVSEKFIKFINTHPKLYDADQSVINGSLKNEILFLNPRYNLVSRYHFKNYENISKLSGLNNLNVNKKIIEEAQNNPAILHFTGSKFMHYWYDKNKSHEYGIEFRKIAKMSPFCHNLLDNINCNFKDKLYLFIVIDHSNLFLKIIPKYLLNKRMNHIINNN